VSFLRAAGVPAEVGGTDRVVASALVTAAMAGACVRVPPEFVAEANELIAACSGGEIARRALGCRRQITSDAP